MLRDAAIRIVSTTYIKTHHMKRTLRSLCLACLLPAAATFGQSTPATSSASQPPPVQFLLEAGGHFFFKTGTLADNLDAEIEKVVKHQRSGFAWSGEAGVVLNGLHQLTVVRTQSSRAKDFNLILFGPGGGAFLPANSTEDLAYTGVNYGVQVPFGKGRSQWMAVVKAGLGVWNYENTVSVNNGMPGAASSSVKENGFGYMTGIRMGYQFSPSLAWFAGTDILGGSVKVQGERENLGQIRLSTTLRLTLPGR